MSEPRRHPVDLDPDEAAFAAEFARSLTQTSSEPPVDAASNPTPAEVARIWSRIVAARDVNELRHSAPRRQREWWALAAAAVLLLTTGALAVWVVNLRQQHEMLQARLSEPSQPSADLARKVEELGQSAAASRNQIAELQQRLDTAVGPQINVPIFEMDPVDALRSAQVDTPTFRVPEAAAIVTVVLNSSAPASSAPYALTIRNGRGAVVWRGDGLRPGPHRAFTLTVPRSLLPAGQYRLELIANRQGRDEVVETYALRIES